MAIQDISISTHMAARKVAESGDTKINGGLDKQRKKYDNKQDEIQSRTSKSFNTNTGGFLTDAATKLAGGTTPPAMARSSMTLPKPPAHQIGSNNVQATGKYVSSIEELEYDMGSLLKWVVHLATPAKNPPLLYMPLP